MRVAIISTPFVAVPPPQYGGTELIVSELCSGLRQSGHQVTLFTCGGSSADCDVRMLYDGARWPPEPYTELDHTSWAVEQILADPRPYDVVHAHLPSALAFARLVEAPMVYTVHHDRDSRLHQQLYRSLYARAPVRFVCISERQRALSPELHGATVIRHGLDPCAYGQGRGDGGYVAFLGRFSPCKGTHHALDAAAEAGVPIVLAGCPHGEDQGYFASQVAPRLQRPGARSLGQIGAMRKAGFLRRARALLFPISWEEPFGLVMIEAMLCGTPVIAFPGGAVEEVIEEGVTGFVVRDVGEMAARIRQLDQFDRRRCWRRAVERWSAARMVADHLHLYRELAQRNLLDERRRAAAPRA